MTVDHLDIRPGVYRDSVTLLRVSQSAAAVPGIRAAQVAMGTALNLDLARELGFGDIDARPDDLVITLRGDDQAAVETGRAAVDVALRGERPSASTGGSTTGADLARSVRSAAAAGDPDDAGLVLLSVPGPAVLGEALDAVAAGHSVMIFSDNVPVEHEIALKDAAAAAGVLMMGPDCGTAILGGVGLGFANALRPPADDRPRVGVVAASGTGAQHLVSLLDDAGVGVSHVIGVGGRDLSAAVGARATVAAVRRLAADPGTDHVVVLSKPAHPSARARLRAVVADLESTGTAVTSMVLGPDAPDLAAATADLVHRLTGERPVWRSWHPTPDPSPTGSGALRGLYSGGTLADEAMLVAAPLVGPIRSNIPLRPEWALPTGGAGAEVLRGQGHAVLDLGDDAYTVGRPHPMIDPTVRLDLLAAQAADPDVAVVLLDVVLGHGADADPAATLAPAIRAAVAAAAAHGRPLAVVVALVGTDADPQDRAAQAAALVAAGALVFAANAEAARAAVALTGADGAPGTATASPAASAGDDSVADAVSQPVPSEPATSAATPALGTPTRVITAGIDLLADALRDQAVAVHAVDFRPPAGLPTGALDALHTVLLDARRESANRTAVDRMLATRAHLVDVRPAREALGLQPGQFLHAGPPITWERASGPLRGALIGAVLFEGLASDEADAVALLERDGGVHLSPCHDHHAVGPMAGVISPSMWLFELADPGTGRPAYCSLNEGLGKVLRYGAYGPAVIEKLRWMAAVLGPALADAVRATAARQPIDLTAIVGQMVQMGDEGHNRNRAGTLMLLRALLPALITSGRPADEVARVVDVVAGNDHFFLNLTMPTGKLMGDAAAGVAGSTVVTAMCRNGTDFGIRVSGTGDEWFTGPANTPQGLFLPGYGADDANPDIGDSAITETMGIGGLVMATAPAIVRLVGGSVPDALATTQRMYEITVAENPAFAVPILEFRGAPTGIDVTRVIRTGILPQINTGMAGRVAGTGQVGAGLVTPPMACFTGALARLAEWATRGAAGG